MIGGGGLGHPDATVAQVGGGQSGVSCIATSGLSLPQCAVGAVVIITREGCPKHSRAGCEADWGSTTPPWSRGTAKKQVDVSVSVSKVHCDSWLRAKCRGLQISDTETSQRSPMKSRRTVGTSAP